MATNADKMRRSPVLVRIVRSQPRLFTSGAVGVVVPALIALLTSWRPATRLLTGWDVGVALYLALVFRMMRRSDVHTIRQRAAEQDEGRLTLLVLTVTAALASLAAIFAQFGSTAAADGRQPIGLALPALWPSPATSGSPTIGTSSIFPSSSG